MGARTHRIPAGQTAEPPPEARLARRLGDGNPAAARDFVAREVIESWSCPRARTRRWRGQRAAAELVDLVRFTRPAPRPRWLDRAHIAEVLAQLTPGSRTVVRLRLMHWTGMRPSQMGRLRPEDFRLDEPTPFVVVPRGKGGRLAELIALS